MSVVRTNIVQIRRYYPTFTESELFVPGQQDRFCWMLEDVGRPTNVKFPGETCIPEGVYDVAISMSTRFKKNMIQLSSAGQDLVISRDGISFKGVRVHGGNDIDDSHGCPLANFNSSHDGKQYGRASDKLVQIIQNGIANGIEYRWVITSN